ncbi:FixH family protein [Enhygromyxa salina]|uniref:FixH family protein n=1 Tax=Enhygromyxa salina TaxID=215803 RepID=UPI0015E6874B|nr:FixH family protein [Enhygromyxa salina]
MGSPCASTEDCGGELICDVHDGQGTCQHEHGHGTHSGEEDAEEDCAADTRAEHYAVGLSKSGSLVTASFVSADPAPPIRGDNSWVLSFSDADGAALDDLEITVTPIMPDHGHGTPVSAEVTPTGVPGEYRLDPVNLFMAGYWEITLDIALADQQDSIMFGFCVD